MFEWEVLEEEKPLPELPPDEPGDRRSRRFWIALALVVLTFAALLAVFVRREMAQRREAMRADLEAFIRQEEQARAFGLRNQAARLIAAGVSWEWWVNYLNSFAQPGEEPRPRDVQVADMQFDGEGALVTLTVNGHKQLRYYRLVGQSWRRAMLPVERVWGTRRFAVEPLDGLNVIYRPPDRAFAQQVARDLPALYASLAEWPEQPRAAQIEFEPRDVAPPLIVAEEKRIVLNSPLLVPQDGLLSGEGAVRLALAAALLDQADGTDESALSLPLLNASRFLEAARTVVAMHWALSPEEQEQQLQAWQEGLGEWLSPFEAVVSLDPGQSAAVLIRRTDMAAYLTAEYIYQVHGPQTLAALVRRLPRADTWDDVFQDVLGRSRADLEREVAAFVADTARKPEKSGSRLAPTSPPSKPPLEVELLAFRSSRTLEALLGTEKTPIQIELPARRDPLYAENGPPVPAGCVGPHSRARLEGEWVVRNQRFQADRVVLTSARLPLVLQPLPPPPDTVGYVVRLDPFRPSAIVALREDGSLHPILELENAIHLRTLPRYGTPLRFVLTFFVPACSRYWVVVYGPREGVVAKWLTEAQAHAEGRAFFHTTWRAEAQDMLFFRSKPASGTWRYQVFRARPNVLVAEPVGWLPPGLLPIGWSAALDRIVALDLQADEPTVVLVASNLRPEKRIPLASTPSGLQLSPDGKFLAFLLSLRETKGAKDTLAVVDLATGTEVLRWSAPPGEGLGKPLWAPLPEANRLIVPAGPWPDAPTETLSSVQFHLFEVDVRDGPHHFTFALPNTPPDIAALQNLAFCTRGRFMWQYENEEERPVIAGYDETTRLAFSATIPRRPAMSLVGCEE